MESHIDIKRRTLENEFAYQDKCLREREDTLLKGLNSVKEVAESIEDSKVAAKINGTICSETEYLERAVKRRRKLLSLTYHQHN